MPTTLDDRSRGGPGKASAPRSFKSQTPLLDKFLSGASTPKLQTKQVRPEEIVSSTPLLDKFLSGGTAVAPAGTRPADDEGYDVAGGVATFVRGLALLPRQTAAKLLGAIQGMDGASVADKGWADREIEHARQDADAFAADAFERYGNKNFLPGIKIQAVAQLPQNLAYSGVTAAGGLTAGGLASMTPAGPPGGYVVGTGVTGTLAYRMASFEIMQEALEAKDEEFQLHLGRGMNAAEESKYKKEFTAAARKHGLWEAIPEAIGSALGFKVLSTPLKKMVGKRLTTRIMGKLAGVYGEELLTETITEKGQRPLRTELGLRGGGDVTWMQAFKDVAPQTILLTTVMGGAVGAGTKVYDRYVGDPHAAKIVREGVAEGLYTDLPDGPFGSILERSRALSRKYPQDTGLKAAVTELEKEWERRRSRDPQPPAEQPMTDTATMGTDDVRDEQTLARDRERRDTARTERLKTKLETRAADLLRETVEEDKRQQEIAARIRVEEEQAAAEPEPPALQGGRRVAPVRTGAGVVSGVQPLAKEKKTPLAFTSVGEYAAWFKENHDIQDPDNKAIAEDLDFVEQRIVGFGSLHMPTKMARALKKRNVYHHDPDVQARMDRVVEEHPKIQQMLVRIHKLPEDVFQKPAQKEVKPKKVDPAVQDVENKIRHIHHQARLAATERWKREMQAQWTINDKRGFPPTNPSASKTPKYARKIFDKLFDEELAKRQGQIDKLKRKIEFIKKPGKPEKKGPSRGAAVISGVFPKRAKEAPPAAETEEEQYADDMPSEEPETMSPAAEAVYEYIEPILQKARKTQDNELIADIRNLQKAADLIDQGRMDSDFVQEVLGHHPDLAKKLEAEAAPEESGAADKKTGYYDKRTGKLVRVDVAPMGNFTFYKTDALDNQGARIRTKVKHYYDTREEAEKALAEYAEKNRFEPMPQEDYPAHVAKIKAAAEAKRREIPEELQPVADQAWNYLNGVRFSMAIDDGTITEKTGIPVETIREKIHAVGKDKERFQGSSGLYSAATGVSQLGDLSPEELQRHADKIPAKLIEDIEQTRLPGKVNDLTGRRDWYPMPDYGFDNKRRAHLEAPRLKLANLNAEYRPAKPGAKYETDRNPSGHLFLHVNGKIEASVLSKLAKKKSWKHFPRDEEGMASAIRWVETTVGEYRPEKKRKAKAETPAGLRPPKSEIDDSHTRDWPHPDDIAARDLDIDVDQIAKPIKDRKKYLARLKTALADHEKALAKDIERYLDVLERGDAAVSDYDKTMGYGPGTSLELKHAHISYNKARVAALRKKIAEEEKAQAAKGSRRGAAAVSGVRAKKRPAVRQLDETGRPTDGKPIKPGDTFTTATGRTTTPYPKQKSERYASQWLIDNAVAEAQARGDSFNQGQFENTTLLKKGFLTDADRESMQMYLFGKAEDQPQVPKPALKPLSGAAVVSGVVPKKKPAAERKAQFEKDLKRKGVATGPDGTAYSIQRDEDERGYHVRREKEGKRSHITRPDDVGWTIMEARRKAFEDAFEKPPESKWVSSGKIPKPGDEAVLGSKSGSFLLHDNREIKFKWGLISARHIRTSHRDSFTAHPDYPQELQPRDRDKGSLQVQVRAMAKNLETRKLGDSPAPDPGAPIVGRDRIVEGGNGRAMAIRTAYNNDWAADYRAWLDSEAETFGFTQEQVRNLKHPILVRVRTGKIKDRAQFTRDLNVSEAAGQSPVETAVADAAALSEADMQLFAPSDKGDIAAASNNTFVNRFLSKMGLGEQVAWVSSEGNATRQLIDRIRGAVFHKAYGDKKLTQLITEESDQEIRGILNALAVAAPGFMKARGMDANMGGAAVVAHVTGAASLIRHAKSRHPNMKTASAVDAVLNQRDLFGGRYPSDTEALARYMAANVNKTRRLGEVLTVVAEKLQEYIRQIPQGNLFGESLRVPATSELMDVATEKVEDKYADRQTQLEFGGPTEAGTRRGGQTASRRPAGKPTAKKKPAGYGQKNKLVSSDRAKELEKRLKAKLNQVSMGVDPEMMAIGTELAVYHIEAGSRAFAEYARVMIESLGEKIKPFLRSFYEGARYYPEMDPETTAAMTPSAEIDAIDLDNIEGGEKDESGTTEPLERDPQDRAAEDPLGQGDVFQDREGSRTDLGLPGGEDESRRPGKQGDPGLPDGEPNLDRTRSDSEIYQSNGEVRTAPGAARPGQRERGDRADAPGAQPERPADDDTARDDSAAERHDVTFAEKIAAQKEANRLPVTFNDEASIRASLPILFPEQQDDVVKAERRFFEANGKGMLFTNGTGTGKTYTGLGIINRFYISGRHNILIVVPSEQKAVDWIEEAENFDLAVARLKDTKDPGRGVNVTTYANFRANEALETREWDLIVYDESHKLISNEAGESTAADQRHKSLGNAPSRARWKAEEKYEKEIAADRKNNNFKLTDATQAKIDAEITRLIDRTKVVFLSATPFAYHKTLRYGDGFLFDILENKDNSGGRGYNEGSSEDRFFMTNFGYRMRYNRLTQPESGADVGLMEREFVERLRREGVLSGRRLQIDFDYSREFVLVDSQLGHQINTGMKIAQGWEDRDNDYRALPYALNRKYTYLYLSQLMEAIKARESIDRYQQHLDLGRKVIVFHNYNHSLPTHPFDFGGLVSQNDPKKLHDEVAHFHENYPQFRQLDLRGLTNPIATITRAFGERAAVFNGTVSKRLRQEAVKNFQRDGSGIDIIVVQMEAGKEGISLHDLTGGKQRVVSDLGLPVKPTDAIQTEGRAYRVGNMSDAIFEYPVLHISFEKYIFGGKINRRVKTAENLAMGAQARDLETSFKEGYANPVEADPHADQGTGGKAADKALEESISEFQRAMTYYFARAKKTARNKAREGRDYFATPEPLGLKMVQWADPRPNERGAEPSAGHGAIARFFPEYTTNTFIEPSAELAAELNVFAKGDVQMRRFEDLHKVNKFDFIVMNPPFGSAGKTAGEHMQKAADHLRDHGRLVIIVPDGPSMQKRLDKFHEDEQNKHLYTVLDMKLPEALFERAATKVRTRVLVLEKQTDPENAPNHTGADMVSAETIQEFFERIEHYPVAPRFVPERRADEPAETDAAGEQFELAQFDHTKTGETLYVAKPKRFLGDDYKRIAAMAKESGGRYSKFKRNGAIPGFVFDSVEKRQAFLEKAGAVEEMSQFARAFTPADHEVTLEDVRAVFPGQESGISVHDPNAFWVRLKTGQGLEIKKVRSIAPDRVAIEAAYGSMAEDGSMIAGKYQAGRIELHRDLAGKWTLVHEAEHAFEALGIITRRDVAVLKRHIRQLAANGKFTPQKRDEETGEFVDIGGKEDRAVWMAAQMEARAKHRPPVARIVARVRDWWTWVVNLVKRTAAGVALDVASGRIVDKAVGGRRITAPAGAPAYERTAGRWHSQMVRFLDQKLPGKGPAVQLAEMVDAWAKKGLIKAEELEWSGLIDFLADKSDVDMQGRVTKKEILDFLVANHVRVDEVRKGGRDAVDISNDIKEIIPDYQNLLNRETALRVSDKKDHEKLNKLYDEMDETDETKFSQYQLPGGTSYKELLLTLPTRDTRRQYLDYFAELKKKYIPDGRFLNLGDAYMKVKAKATSEEMVKLDRLDDESVVDTGYTSGHWEEKNVLAHVRFNERTDADGKRVLFVEEIQSDWHQEGRKKGYKDELEHLNEGHSLDEYEHNGQRLYQVVNEGGFRLTGGYPDRESALKEYQEARKGYGADYTVPAAPFKKTWPMLAFKRMVRFAAENGFDKIAWTPGEVQAERYDLSKQVEQISWARRTDGTYDLTIYPVNGDDKITYDRLTDSKMEDTIGKELTQNIKNDPGENINVSGYESIGDLSGVDLKVGGEGMKGFYDKILPAAVKKFFGKKAWGKARVGVTSLQINEGREERPVSYIEYPDGVNVLNADGVVVGETNSVEAAKRMVAEWAKSKEVWSLPITPEMRQKALREGMPLFSIVNQPQTGQQVDDEIQKNRTFVNRLHEMGDQGRHSVSVIAAQLQEQVQELAGAKSKKRFHVGLGYKKRIKDSQAARQLDRAMLFYRDAGADPAAFAEFREKAQQQLESGAIKGDQALYVKQVLRDLDVAENLSDEQKQFVEMMGERFEDAYGLASESKVVQSHVDNYVRRIYKKRKDLEETATFTGWSGPAHGFKVAHGAAMKRKYDTALDAILDGWQLAVEGITSSFESYLSELSTVLANKAFIQKGVNTKDAAGRSLFTTNSSSVAGYEDYRELKADGFSVWQVTGTIAARDVEGLGGVLETNSWGKKVFLTKPEFVPEAWAVYKSPAAKRPSKVFYQLPLPDYDAKAAAEQWAEEHLYTRIEYRDAMETAKQFQKLKLWAPAPIADMLNRMTATDPLFSQTPVLKAINRLNAGLKSWILMSSFFHHLAGARSWIFGVHHGWGRGKHVVFSKDMGTVIGEFKEMEEAERFARDNEGVALERSKATPILSYKAGLDKVNDMHPLVAMGVRNGLTLGSLQDWAESELRKEGGLTERLVRFMGWEKASRVVAFGRFKRETWSNSLFKKFFAGLKAEAFCVEYAHELAKAQEKYQAGKQSRPPDAEKIAENVARLINADFGGLHLKRMGRNPTLQYLARLTLLAPDWTESNFRTVTGMIPGLNEKITKLIGDVPPPKGMDKIYRKFWGRVMLRIAVSTIIAQILLNGMDDTEEFIAEQAGSNRWNKFRWTELDVTKLYHALGIDTEGQRKTFSIGGHFFDPLKLLDPWRLIKGKSSPFARAMAAGFSGTDWADRPFTGAAELLATGRTVKKSSFERTEEGFDRLPSVVINQVFNMQPIQVGHFLRYLQGEEDGLTALLHSMGAATHTAWKPVPEGPVTDAAGDAVVEEIERLSTLGLLRSGPPSRTVVLAGIPRKMTSEQYQAYLQRSSERVGRKARGLVTSPDWKRMSDREKGVTLARIIRSARQRVRKPIKKRLARMPASAEP